MKRRYFFSFQVKFIIILIALMTVSFFTTWYMVRDITRSITMNEKEAKLVGLTHILNSRLGPGTYDDILRQRGADSATREEKIQILNEALTDITKEYRNGKSFTG